MTGINQKFPNTPFRTNPGLRDNIPADPPPWRICPSCGVENNEHKVRCERANWNVNKYCGGTNAR